MISVSVIIPTYNEQDNIGRCLESLLSQTLTSFEIIVVDDGSTDFTLEIVAGFKKVKILKQKHKGPGSARNKGAKQAKGTILVFVDADMTFEKNFLKNLIRPIEKGITIGTFSKDEFVANMDNNWAKSWSIVRGFEKGKMHPSDYPDEQAVFRAIRKDAFLSVGGFDEDRGYDDDWTLSEKLGIKATAVQKAKFYHYNPESIQEIWLQSKWLSKRKYKFGLLGKFLRLMSVSLPISLLRSTQIMLKHQSVYVGLTQIVSDLAMSIGILEEIIFEKVSK